MVLEFEIPGLPKMTNQLRVHWRVKHNEAKMWKGLVAQIVLNHPNRPIAPLHQANVTLVRHSAREPDFDGLVSSFKNCIDSLKECGVIIDDKVSVIGQPTYRWIYASPNQGKISIKVEAR